MPNITYTVASAHQGTVTRSASFGGAEVEAQVPALVVELVSADGGMGHTFSFIGAAEIAAALPVFQLGATVVAAFTLQEA